MAGNAVIGALRAVIGADTASLDKGLKDSQSKLSAFGQRVATVGAAAAAAFAAVGVAVAVSIKRTIDQADELTKAAQKWGVPVDELSRLKHAADLSGVGLEGLGTSLSKLSRNMSDVAGGAQNTASQAFAALGVAVTNADGSLKSSSEVMTELAGKFENLKDGAGKTALAMALFGKSGAEIIPLLNAGSQGLKSMMEEADKLGIVIDSKTGKAAENFNDNLTRLGRVKDGIILKITEGMLPGLEQLSVAMVRVASDTSALNVVGSVVGTMFAGMIHEVEKFRLALARLPVEWEAFKTLMTTPNFFGDFKKLWGDFNAVLQESDRQLQQLVESQRKLAPITLEAIAATIGLSQAQEKAAAPIIKSAELSKEAISEVTAALREEQAVRTRMIADASRLVEQSAPLYEQYRMELAKNQVAMAMVGATSAEVARVNEMTAQKFGNTWAQVSDSVAGSIKDIGSAFAKESGAMAAIAKAAGIVQATISMFVGAAKALELPFPANLAAWATVLGTGAQMVAGIKGTDAGGFATGGSIKVPGGMGGGDRVPAMVDLEPGEQLDIWRPGENGGADPRRGAQGGGGVTTINMVGDTFSRRTVEKMIDALNDAFGDGHKLIMKPA